MIQENVDLKKYNTFGLSATAKYFSVFSSISELKGLLESNKDLPLLVLGGGSNVLLTQDVEGLVLKNELKGITIEDIDDTEVYVSAQAGENWHDLVLFCLENNLAGIENLSLIPGSVGAAPMQNIGAYGVEIKDVFVDLEALNVASSEMKVFTHEDCKFGYRESVFKRALKGEYIICSVRLKLSRKVLVNTSYGAITDRLKEMQVTNPSIKDVSDAVIHIRQSKLPDPKEIGNSGSFFKNPVVNRQKFEELKSKFPGIANYPIDQNNVKIAAGWLIDQAGWKGKTIGNYGVHKNQALVLVNYGNAKGIDIYQLSEEILASIKEIYGIELEREVNVV
jgi:UDP-N-acetylmuramate dehydrogenase